MSWGAAMMASLLVVLPRPGTWVVALAAFLLRGGILVFLVPILVLPSAVGLATILGPTITAFWLGGLSFGFAAVVAAIFGGFFLWLVVGGWVAAITERDLIRAVAADEDLGLGRHLPPVPAARQRGRIWRIVLLRLAGHVPLAVALGYGSMRLVQATYRELTLPSDVLTPIGWRVISAAPDAVIAIALAWTLGEVLGSLGARRLVLWGQSIDQAYVGAWADLVRRPLTTIATYVVPTAVLVVATGPIVVGAGAAWSMLRALLVEGRPGTEAAMAGTLLVFLGTWSAGLVLAGLLTAWRQRRVDRRGPARPRDIWGIDRQPTGGVERPRPVWHGVADRPSGPGSERYRCSPSRSPAPPAPKAFRLAGCPVRTAARCLQRLRGASVLPSRRGWRERCRRRAPGSMRTLVWSRRSSPGSTPRRRGTPSPCPRPLRRSLPRPTRRPGHWSRSGSCRVPRQALPWTAGRRSRRSR